MCARAHARARARSRYRNGHKIILIRRSWLQGVQFVSPLLWIAVTGRQKLYWFFEALMAM